MRKELSRSKKVGSILLGSLLAFTAWAPLAYSVVIPCVGTLNAQDDTVLAYKVAVVVPVLENDVRPPGVALTVSIVWDAETDCAGTIDVDFDAVVYTPTTPLLVDCTIKYRATSPRGAESTNALIHVKVDAPPKTIFADGFESGNTAAWSSCIGC